ncbi:Vegetative incompatibility protein HET-E-1 [Daldinia childiae]|uniref:Vegetative incompatibility protein HET-E-1 n=1 Tax=Daldinia childiae TaxID=326645 RepID=UPI0014468856|nr:Vegetative incompatibility protein HET-E-1 [Daldinia childiae]KAF3057116.1 Vegetative incompatibility protein HET-E-1 [Daldinia childiae]
MASTSSVSPQASAPQSGFDKALAAFRSRLTPSETAQFQVATLDDLKVTILAIQRDQRDRKKMMHMDRISSFLEAMEQFGKVVETFLNISEMLAFIWGPIKLLLLTAATWLESFDALLDAYQLIAENLPTFKIYQNLFRESDSMQELLQCIWVDIFDFHIQALRIFGQSMIRLFFRSLWKDFNGRFHHIISDLKRQKALVESYATQIHIQNYEYDRRKTQEEFEQAQAHRTSEKKAYIMQWMMAPKSLLDHEFLCSVRKEQLDVTNRQTAHWILQHNEIEAWVAPQVPKSSIIWLSGIPGAGKSVLTSVIVDEIKKKNHGPIALFYCKHRDPDKNTFTSIAKGLLSQLINQQDDLIPFYYDEAIRSGESSLHSTKLCKRLLRNMLQAVPLAFLVIDGIDECDSTERKCTLDFLNNIINICDNNKPGKIRLFISSRDESDIRRALLMGTRIEINREDIIEDLKVYIGHRASVVQRKFELDAEEQGYIQHNVLDKSDGMFLYAKLVMANLEGQPTRHHLRQEFDSLPSGLEEAYDRNLRRITSNPNRNQAEVARRILLLMVCARRPLRWREVQAAISISLDEQALDSTRRLSQGSDVTEICGSLIEVLPGDCVDFIHTTASL